MIDPSKQKAESHRGSGYSLPDGLLYQSALGSQEVDLRRGRGKRVVARSMARLGERALMPFLIHPHMLRHSCGFKYANEGKDTRSLQAYMGHRNIQSTVRYAAMPDRFLGWERE